MLLHVAFQEGFAGQSVALRVDGAEAYRKAGVTTRVQIGLADTVEVDVEPGTVQLEVSVGDRPTAAHAVTVNGPTYVAVSLDDAGKPTFQTSKQPFGYV